MSKSSNIKQPYAVIALTGVLLFCLGWMLLNTWFALQGKAGNTTTKTLTVSTWGNENETATLHSLLQEFEAQHPGLQVRVRHMPEFYTQSLQMLLAANQSPDVMMLNSLDIKRFCQANLLIPLQNEPGLNAFYPSALKSLSLENGTLCALPRDISNLVIYVNLDLLQELSEELQAKAQPRWHLNDMETVAKAFVELPTPASAKRWGIGVYQSPALFWLPYVWSEGGQWFTSVKGTPAIQPDSVTVGALERYKRYSHTLGIAPKRTQVANTTMTELFVQKRLLFLPSGRWSTPFLRENAPFKWDVLPFPAGKAGSRVGIDTTGYALSRSTPHPEHAKALLHFLVNVHASKAWSESGLIIPARKDVARSPAFLQPQYYPEHSQVFLEAMTTGVPSPYPANWPSMGQRLNTAMDAYLNTPALKLMDTLAQAGLQQINTPTPQGKRQ